jgi:hypothetical protein
MNNLSLWLDAKISEGIVAAIGQQEEAHQRNSTYVVGNT